MQLTHYLAADIFQGKWIRLKKSVDKFLSS